MAKYKIAWMPGDGVGHDVMEAARLVLDRLKLDAEYVPCDIGWEFWCKEGNALPDRTVKALKETTCGLFKTELALQPDIGRAVDELVAIRDHIARADHSASRQMQQARACAPQNSSACGSQSPR